MRKTAILFLILISLLFAFREEASVYAAENSTNPYTEILHKYSLTAINPTSSDLQSTLEQNPQIQAVYLQGELPPAESVDALMAQYPNVTFYWEFDVLGVPTSASAETLDLSDIPLESTDALEAVLPRFHRLKTVDMCRCGLSNEEMDELNRKYPDIQFVWEVKISGFYLRTDAKYLMPYLYGYKVHDWDLHNLKYCTQIECIDFGHMEISSCSVLENMPNLRFLILADTDISNLAPLGTLSKLEFLEIFLTSATDLYPLTNCTSLSDLNISWTPVQDFTPLLHMTQLDRLWMGGCYTTQKDQQALSDALTNTSIVFFSNASTNKGWRHAPNYYRQRDILGMFYMYT